VYSGGVVDAGRGRVARIQQTEGDSSKQFRPWMPLKKHRRAAGSLSCVHTMGALRCTEINDSEGVLGIFVHGKRTGDAFCRRSGRVPSGRSTTERGVPKWAQTQRRGASAGRESHVLGMARIMDAFEELSGSRDAPTSAMQEKNT